jgi:hypothetical protein
MCQAAYQRDDVRWADAWRTSTAKMICHGSILSTSKRSGGFKSRRTCSLNKVVTARFLSVLLLHVFVAQLFTTAYAMRCRLQTPL